MKGFSKKKGIDLKEVYFLVVMISSIQVVLSLASMDLAVEQFNMRNAFLHDDLKVEVYYGQPEGFQKKDKPALVCKIKKSFYGLKQASQ